MKNVPAGFTLSNGASLNTLPAVVKRACEFLDKAPLKVIYTTFDLASAVGVIANTVQANSTHPALAEYRINHNSRVLWGSRKTIREFKRLREKQNAND